PGGRLQTGRGARGALDDPDPTGDQRAGQRHRVRRVVQHHDRDHRRDVQQRHARPPRSCGAALRGTPRAGELAERFPRMQAGSLRGGSAGWRRGADGTLPVASTGRKHGMDGTSPVASAEGRRGGYGTLPIASTGRKHGMTETIPVTSAECRRGAYGTLPIASTGRKHGMTETIPVTSAECRRGAYGTLP